MRVLERGNSTQERRKFYLFLVLGGGRIFFSFFGIIFSNFSN